MEENKYLDITCKIMNAAMKGESLDLSAYDNDPEFLRIMKEQTFLPFLYEVDKRKIWRKYYYQAYLINEKFDAIGKKIKDIFDANNIDHIFLKGYELRKLYPKPWLRQMGDIDVLVREDDFEKASKLLSDNDFIFDHQIEYHSEFKFDNYSIELHNKLVSNKENLFDFFSNPFKASTKYDKHSFKIDLHYNVTYLINHYIKHLKSGAGIRELCDFYLLLNENEIDDSLILSNLKLTNNEKFWDTILTVLHYIFNFNKYPYKPNEHVKRLLNYSIEAGIHGFGKNNNRIKNEFLSSKQSKFIFLLKKLFIPLKTLFKIYPWTLSIILIPFGYLFRLIHLIKHKKESFQSIVQANETDNLLKQLGIN